MTMHSFRGFCMLLEYDRSKALAALGQKFTSKVDDDINAGNKTPDQIMSELEDADPTPNHQYTNWLARAYLNGDQLDRLLDNVRPILSKLEVIKKRKLIRPEHADIGRFKNLRDLAQAVNQYSPAAKAEREKGDSTVLMDNDELRIIHPLTQAAACYYGRGTKWCTAAKDNNNFENFTGDGGLFIVLPKKPKHTGEKYQIHLDSDDPSLMDEKDEEFKWVSLWDRFPTLAKLHYDGAARGQSAELQTFAKRLAIGIDGGEDEDDDERNDPDYMRDDDGDGYGDED